MIFSDPMPAFIVLLIAHLIGDFVIQTEQMALKKAHVFGWLFLHASQLGIITWLLCWSWEVWPIVLAVFSTHLIFDWIKPRLPGDPLKWYIYDQAAHLLVIWWGACWMVQHLSLIEMPLSGYLPFNCQVIIAAYLLVGRPLTIGMGLFLKPWQGELSKSQHDNGPPEGMITGLTRSSEWIGNLERFFTLTAVLAGQFILVAAILIAKAIIRYGEIVQPGQRKRADYIIVGTLGSISLAVVVGLLARQLL